MECPICLEEYDGTDHRPMSLPCGHSLCSECLGDINECPQDRKPILDKASVPVNYALQAAFEEYNSQRKTTSPIASLSVTSPTSKSVTPRQSPQVLSVTTSSDDDVVIYEWWRFIGINDVIEVCAESGWWYTARVLGLHGENSSLEFYVQSNGAKGKDEWVLATSPRLAVLGTHTSDLYSLPSTPNPKRQAIEKSPSASPIPDVIDLGSQEPVVLDPVDPVDWRSTLFEGKLIEARIDSKWCPASIVEQYTDTIVKVHFFGLSDASDKYFPITSKDLAAKGTHT